MAEFANQVRSELSVAFKRLRRAATAGVLFQPVVEILGERWSGSFDSFFNLPALYQFAFRVTALDRFT
ncbi:MAG: hypothetical protein ABSB35_05490 [Bryobacteraceae bacterium]